MNKKMSEAEVSLRLALFLIRSKLIVDQVSIAIDGAQIKIGNTIHFSIKSFSQDNECRKKDTSDS